MTNFEILKDSIWDAVKNDDKEAFNKNCESLMGKACNDIWRIGWSLRPKDINAVYELLDDEESINELIYSYRHCT